MKLTRVLSAHRKHLEAQVQSAVACNCDLSVTSHRALTHGSKVLFINRSLTVLMSVTEQRH